MYPLNSTDSVDSLFDKALAIVYKHSTRCPMSSVAYHQVQMYCDERPAAPVYIVDVINHRDVSKLIAKKTGVQHESPQIIVLKHGKVTWEASHSSITEEAIAGHAGF
ncbi:bacillithiol system redox-active protein YtxJ [Candidatus Woesearchaeota archaeon]|nr:bacillithiol system redox-active protein YtxJ [Candidatus Woesearchaeota archaeon]